MLGKPLNKSKKSFHKALDELERAFEKRIEAIQRRLYDTVTNESVAQRRKKIK